MMNENVPDVERGNFTMSDTLTKTDSHIRLDKIRGLPQNPKEHDIGEIVVSIERFGFLDPIVINSVTGNLIGGHGRVDALRWLKVQGKRIPEGIEVDKDSMWLVPQYVVNVAEQDEGAAAVALNRLVERGGWDETRLLAVLDDLAARGKEALEGIGFDGDDLDRMRQKIGVGWSRKDGDGDGSTNELEKDDSDEAVLDEQVNDEAELSWSMGAEYAGEQVTQIAREAQAEFNVKEGQVWRAGRQYVLCGDSLDKNNWRILLDMSGIKLVDGVFTSPPYAWRRKWFYDPIQTVNYVQWFEAAQRNAFEYLSDTGSFFLNIKPHTEEGERSLYVMDLVIAMKREWGWCFVEEYCWERTAAPGTWRNRFKNGWDSVYHFSKTPDIDFYPDSVANFSSSGVAKAKMNANTGKHFNAVKDFSWDASRPSNRLPELGTVQGVGHPAAFPVELPMFFIMAFSLPNSAWIDPFMGAGSTLLACNDLNRTGLGIELKPEYCAIALKRLREAGKQPVVLSDV